MEKCSSGGGRREKLIEGSKARGKREQEKQSSELQTNDAVHPPLFDIIKES